MAKPITSVKPDRLSSGGVEISVGVEPDHAEILAAGDAGRGAQAAHAIAGQDECERMPIACGSDTLSQTPRELEDPRDLRQCLIDRHAITSSSGITQI
jgi:hypothetical protein